MRIKDLALEPYEIEMEGPNSFIIITTKVIPSGKEKGNIRETQEGYYTSLESVIKKVVLLKLHDKNKNNEEAMTLQAFLAEYVRISNHFSKLLVKGLEKISVRASLAFID